MTNVPEKEKILLELKAGKEITFPVGAITVGIFCGSVFKAQKNGTGLEPTLRRRFFMRLNKNYDYLVRLVSYLGISNVHIQQTWSEKHKKTAVSIRWING